MSIELHTVANGIVRAQNDGKLYAHQTSSIGGIISGAGVTSSGGLVLHVNAGWGIACGRLFTINADDITITPAASGTKKGRLYLQIDLTNASTPIAFKSIAVASLPALRQDNLAASGTIYEIELAHYDVTPTTVSSLVSNSKVVVVAPRAAADENGNNIASTYMTKTGGTFTAPIEVSASGFPRINVTNPTANKRLFMEVRNGGAVSLGVDNPTTQEMIGYIVNYVPNEGKYHYAGGTFDGDVTAPNLFVKNDYTTNLCNAGSYAEGTTITLSEPMTNFEEIEITWLLQGNGNNPVIMRYNSSDLFAGRYLVDSVYFSETMHNYVGLAYVGPTRLRVNEAVGSEEWAAPVVALVRGLWRK